MEKETETTENTERSESLKNSAFKFITDSSPLKKFIRPLEHVVLLTPPHFNCERIDTTISTLTKTLTTEINNTESLFLAYNKLGIAYFRLFDFDRSEACHQRHLLLSQSSQFNVVSRNNKGENKVEKKIALVNIGCVFHVKRNFDLALDAFKEAMKLAEELSDEQSMARIYANMSHVYQDQCNFDAAVECEQKRMEKVELNSDIDGQIKCAYSLGCLNQLIGETRISIEYYEKAVINMKMKIITKQLEDMNVLKPADIGEESGELNTSSVNDG